MSTRNRRRDDDVVARAPAARGRGGAPHLALAAGITIVALLVLVVAALLAVPDHNRAAARASHGRAPVGPTTAPLSSAAPPALAPAQAEVRIGSPRDATRVPRSFFGISTEYSSLPVYEQQLPLFERVLSLLHVRGDGPLVLRIGGNSADDTLWEPKAGRTPPWAIGLTPQLLRRTRRLVRRDGVKLILDLNLITASPKKAARLARAAEHTLPRGSIIGFEIGNEPDDYSPKNWLATVAVTPFRAGFLPDDVSTGTYTHDFRSYGRAVARVAPGIPLAGPALANPVRHAGWISSLLSSPHRGLGMVTAHRYLYSACARHHSASYPTIARLLSEHATADMAHKLIPAVRMAHRAGLEFRLTELNSVSCQGVRGVSNAFATALWAPDALFELLRAGLDGVNIHVRTDAINAAFTLSHDGLGARPLLYGMILFARTLSADPQLARVKLRDERLAASEGVGGAGRRRQDAPVADQQRQADRERQGRSARDGARTSAATARSVRGIHLRRDPRRPAPRPRRPVAGPVHDPDGATQAGGLRGDDAAGECSTGYGAPPAKRPPVERTRSLNLTLVHGLAARPTRPGRVADAGVDDAPGGVPAPRPRPLWGSGHDPDVLD